MKVFQGCSYKTIVKLARLQNLEMEHVGDIWALGIMISKGRYNLQAVNKYMLHNTSK